MKTLAIRWQRLVDERGQTCNRCGTTEKEIEKAFQSLKESLAPLGIEVTMEKIALDLKSFINNPDESNRVWIAERPLEVWLNAKTGRSPCCDICGDAECRTIEVDGQVYETIPSALIVKAGLQAASRLIDTQPESPCCPKEPESKCQPRNCCPNSNNSK